MEVQLNQKGYDSEQEFSWIIQQNKLPELSDSYLFEQYLNLPLKVASDGNNNLLSDNQLDTKEQSDDDIDSLQSQFQEEVLSSSILDYGPDVKNVGFLKVEWMDGDRVSDYKYGTAFMLSQYCLLSCAHNLHLQPFHDRASRIIFVPGVQGSIENAKKYSNRRGNFYRSHQLKSFHQTYDLYPLRNELCLIVLSKPIHRKSYCKIGITDVKVGQSLEIIGYPSKQNRGKSQISSIRATRVLLKGQAISSQGCILNHNLQTNVGFSGSPIFTQNKEGQYVVIGIHTHRGEGSINRGLFFTQEIIKDLEEFKSDLSLAFKLPLSIRYVKDNIDMKGCRLVSSSKTSLGSNYTKELAKTHKLKILPPSNLNKKHSLCQNYRNKLEKSTINSMTKIFQEQFINLRCCQHETQEEVSILDSNKSQFSFDVQIGQNGDSLNSSFLEDADYSFNNHRFLQFWEEDSFQSIERIEQQECIMFRQFQVFQLDNQTLFRELYPDGEDYQPY